MKLFCHTGKGMTVISFTLLSILINNSIIWAQDGINIVPDYLFFNKVDLPTVTSGSLNYEDLTIAIATDSQGNIYTLTFGSGVDKKDPEGNLLRTDIIPASQLDSPRDLAIDEDGYFYIADYLAAGETYKDNGKIRVFDPAGNYLPDRTIFTSFYRPLGLDIVGDNIYVAEYYDGLQGPEKGSVFSRIRIYDKNSHAVLKENELVELPLRIATGSFGNIYVSQAGSDTPAVLILNTNLQILGELPGIISPGSIIVDDFDFIHVIEYGNRINFSDFINFETLAFGDILDISEEMMLGIQNEDFVVKIYKADGSLVKTLVDQIDFPVDLAMNSCDNFYVDNAEIFGGYAPLFGYAPSRLEFDLEMYKRNPGLDAAEAPEISCTDNIEVDAISGENYAIVDFPVATATDNCSVSVTQTQGMASGSQFPIGESIIEFTATDGAGNMAVCSFTILVNGNTDLVPQFADCPLEMEFSSEPGKCGAVVNFETPTASDETGNLEVSQTKGNPSGSFFPIGDFQIVFEAVDAQGNRTECSFIITVTDDEPPLAECPGSLNFSVPFGVTGRVVEFSQPNVTDNCSEILIEQTEGLTSGSDFPVGLTTNSFLITDASGNTSTCSFTVLIEENEDTEAPKIVCPENIFMDTNSGECGLMVNYPLPQVSDNSGVVYLELVSGPASGNFFKLGLTTVTFKAIDPAGNSSACSFEVSVSDKQSPVLVGCPSDQQETISTQNFILPDYRSQVSVTDCTDNIVVTQFPEPGTAVSETTLIQIIAEDDAGNRTECTFQVVIETEVLEITDCPFSRTEELGLSCVFTVPDYTVEVLTNHASEINQFPSPGTILTKDTQVVFTATDSNGATATCSMEVLLEDTSAPVIYCQGNKEFTFNPLTGFAIPDFRDQADITDNCTYEVVQEPAPGTVIFESQAILLTVIDASGNENSCSFEIVLTEEALPVIEIISCPSNKTLNLEADCSTTLPDLTTEVTTNISAEIIQDPLPGTILTKDAKVVFTATDANGATATCSMEVLLEDTSAPVIYCPGNKEFTFNPLTGFAIPDFRDQVDASDNCTFEVMQDPLPETVVFESQNIQLTVKDASGNQNSCSFEIMLTAEELPVVEITSCSANRSLNLNTNCSVTIPDLTAVVKTNISAEILQSPAAGTTINENTSVLISATDENGNTDSCTVVIEVMDLTAPEISCGGDLLDQWNPEEGYILPDFSANVASEDNCGDFSLIQQPAPGTLILEEISEISFIARDNAGNSSSCSFLLHLSKEEILEISCPGEQVGELSSNCDYQLPDFTSLAGISTENAVIQQEPSPGEIVFSDTSVLLTATFEGKTTSCTFNLILKDTQPPQVSCKDSQIIELGSDGTITVSPEDIDAGSTDNCGIVSKTLSRSSFTIADIGEQKIIFTVRDAAGNESSCESTIFIEGQEEPSEIQCLETVTLHLDENKSAILVPQNLFSGGSGTIQFTVEKEKFGCADLGEQMVKFSYVTPSGEGSCAIKVIVDDPNGFCIPIVDDPSDSGPFVILYPNPSSGMVYIYTSQDIVLEKAEIFDMRGRFLFKKDYDDKTKEFYNINLTGYEAGVYTIKLLGPDGKYIRRAIVRND